MSKTIKSIYGGEWTMEDYTPSAGSFAGVPCVTIAPNGDHVRIFPVAELLAAIDEDGLGLASYRAREADEARLAAIDRAEAAEAKLEEIDLNPWKARAQDAAAKLRDAEATIQRVREELDPAAGHRTSYQILAAVADALDPVPPFTLPTEAGAEFYATRDGREERFDTYTNGETCLYEGKYGITTGADLMANWTNHRLIGADE